ncbi:MAG: DnaJ domain-containing protein [Terracidiphilus sp.]
MIAAQTLDYYEFLQISPNADHDTIHRIYKFLAARFHPDNPDSGDPEKFYLLKSAYDILSDPGRRAKYDSQRAGDETEKQPMSSSVDFMDNLQGELNRRLAVLAVLYYQRRTSPYNPEVSLADIEKRMGFPRDYLDFTTWYLVRKNYVSKADNSDFALTAEGVDFVETQRISIPVLNKLLTNGAEAAAASAAAADIAEAASHASEPPERPVAPSVERQAVKTPMPTPGTALEVTATPAPRKAASRGPIIPGLASITISEMIPAPSPAVANIEKFVMVGKALFKERRTTPKERRSGASDTRTQKVERRQNNRDRRSR